MTEQPITVNQGVAIMQAWCRYLGVDDHTTVIVPPDFQAGYLAAASPATTAEERWWVCTDILKRRGKKIVGPFASQDLALKVRSYIEKAVGHERLFVDAEPAAYPQRDEGER